ncbi:hypothetical protein [Clostridium butanoliproducens]|uniref:hypothetical protein n=1 Tax=Clostridium butanoliproducens TaxID=2991837 RepID=UPI0024BA607D|nr:hypothetical protein [Clostridium butanoliproducens]MDU1348755.1 hypothetical protein [Clostridium argentinense]
MNENTLKLEDSSKIENNQDFEFIGCDTFNPDFTSSSASMMWYKAGETMAL